MSVENGQINPPGAQEVAFKDRGIFMTPEEKNDSLVARAIFAANSVLYELGTPDDTKDTIRLIIRGTKGGVEIPAGLVKRFRNAGLLHEFPNDTTENVKSKERCYILDLPDRKHSPNIQTPELRIHYLKEVGGTGRHKTYWFLSRISREEQPNTLLNTS